MSAKTSSDKARLATLRTWIEIDAKAAKKNYDTFRKMTTAKLWSVVKSNAYGHGLYAFSELMQEFGIDGFCVDSVVEGLSLRRAGIKKPILVLGQTLPSRYAEAAAKKITISISNFEALKELSRESLRNTPDFHIKIDTGMHRQGFYVEDLPKIIRSLRMGRGDRALARSFRGVFTHFASAKDINYPTYTDEQLKKFEKAVALFEKAGFKNLEKHVSATGATLIDSKYHLDAVRVGIGLYGLWPSKELEVQLGEKIKLHPVLRWRTVIGEVKKIKAGDYVGYDLTERVPRNIMMAVLPIGYWHGLARALSNGGEVVVAGKRAKILGRISMDMTAIAVPPGVRPGDVVTIVGESILAAEQAAKAGTIHYEFLTRLNPLIERVIIR